MDPKPSSVSEADSIIKDKCAFFFLSRGSVNVSEEGELHTQMMMLQGRIKTLSYMTGPMIMMLLLFNYFQIQKMSFIQDEHVLVLCLELVVVVGHAAFRKFSHSYFQWRVFSDFFLEVTCF